MTTEGQTNSADGDDQQTPPFNPLSTEVLIESIRREFERQPLHPMPPTDVPSGAGVYAIYYFGNARPYAKIGKHNQTAEVPLPLYVGKAQPDGSRIGMTPGEIGYRVQSRLANHAKRISETAFKLDEFRCRFLIMDPIWVPLGESLLIGGLEPAWNLVVAGFGNNPVGKGRIGQRRAEWDVLHPGRAWASELADDQKSTGESLAEQLDRHFASIIEKSKNA